MKKIFALALWYSISVFSETDLFFVVPDVEDMGMFEQEVPQIFVLFEDED